MRNGLNSVRFLYKLLGHLLFLFFLSFLLHEFRIGFECEIFVSVEQLTSNSASMRSSSSLVFFELALKPTMSSSSSVDCFALLVRFEHRRGNPFALASFEYLPPNHVVTVLSVEIITFFSEGSSSLTRPGISLCP